MSMSDSVVAATNEAIDKAGGTRLTARKIGVADSVVSNWRRRGVSKDYALLLETACGGAVPKERLAPVLYPAAA